MIAQHCKVMSYANGMYRQICPHCRHVFEEFESMDDRGDKMRALESQENHTIGCPGRTRCTGGRMY